MIVVQFENVSKVYDLHAGRRSLLSALKFGRTVDTRGEYFRALSSVSLEVRKGETIGIVGRNGSGKSTLLKIIAGITEPTSGAVTINGRISSLIELGAGFHPDLTGRENIYMNAAILGLPRKFIDAKFREIVDFAEIWDFIDVPVKKYSSGMYARLGFAVASVVEPDILIVDEVLAVGDEGFQRKCYAKIENLRRAGVSIILVSHSASAIIELCNRAILLDEGEVVLEGQPKFVISKYHQLVFSRSDTRDSLRASLKGVRASDTEGVSVANVAAPNERKKSEDQFFQEFFDASLTSKSRFSYADRSYRGVKIHDPKILTRDGKEVNHLILGRTYSFIFDVVFHDQSFNVRFGMLIKTITGFDLGGATTSDADQAIPLVEGGTIAHVRFDFKCLVRPGGVYYMNAGVRGVVDGAEEYLDRLVDACVFKVLATNDDNGNGAVSFMVEPSSVLEKMVH